MERSAELGGYFLAKLRGLRSPLINEVRGRGLWIGVVLNTAARKYCEALKDEGSPLQGDARDDHPHCPTADDPRRGN